MTVHIIGAGAIGAIVGAQLIRAGQDVTLVDANAEHVHAIRTEGLTLAGEVDVTVRPRALTPAELDEELHTVLLAVKSVHTADALATVAPLLAPDGVVVSLQNGLEEYTIAAAVGEERTVGALVTFGGFYEGPGRVRFGGGGTLSIGELDGRITPRLRRLADLLGSAHEVEVTDDIFGRLWSKAAVAAPYFATAVADRDVPDLFAERRHRPVFGALVAEVAAVARAEGIRCTPLDGFSPEDFLAEPADAATLDRDWDAQIDYWMRHSQRRTGVWRDLAIHHRRTEVDHILGPVRDRGVRAGIAVTGVQAVIDAVHDVEDGRRALGPQLLEELAVLLRSGSAR